MNFVRKLLGVDSDARIVALLRGLGLAAALAAIAGVQAALTDPSYEEFAWVPIAAYLLRQLEGFLDHHDDSRSG